MISYYSLVNAKTLLEKKDEFGLVNNNLEYFIDSAPDKLFLLVDESDKVEHNSQRVGSVYFSIDKKTVSSKNIYAVKSDDVYHVTLLCENSANRLSNALQYNSKFLNVSDDFILSLQGSDSHALEFFVENISNEDIFSLFEYNNVKRILFHKLSVYTPPISKGH